MNEWRIDWKGPEGLKKMVKGTSTGSVITILQNCFWEEQEEEEEVEKKMVGRPVSGASGSCACVRHGIIEANLYHLNSF